MTRRASTLALIRPAESGFVAAEAPREVDLELDECHTCDV